MFFKSKKFFISWVLTLRKTLLHNVIQLVICAVTNFEVKIPVCSQSSNNSYISVPAVFNEEVSSLITHIICNKTTHLKQWSIAPSSEIKASVTRRAPV